MKITMPKSLEVLYSCVFQRKENEMRKLLLCAAVALAMGAARSVRAESCIYSGSTERPCSYVDHDMLAELESFAWWKMWGEPIPRFTSFPPSLFMYFIVK